MIVFLKLGTTDSKGQKQKRIPFLKNKAEKLLKTRNCGKNKAKNKATDVVENKRRPKNKPKTNRRNIGLAVACLDRFPSPQDGTSPTRQPRRPDEPWTP